MDTDELSIETFQGVLAEAERFDHDLTLQFGVLAGRCVDEDEFLAEAIELIKLLKTYRREDLSDVFFERIPDLKSFRKTLEVISNNIQRIRQTPLADRTFEDW